MQESVQGAVCLLVRLSVRAGVEVLASEHTAAEAERCIVKRH